jgi:hypothetical protein
MSRSAVSGEHVSMVAHVDEVSLPAKPWSGRFGWRASLISVAQGCVSAASGLGVAHDNRTNPGHRAISVTWFFRNPAWTS